MPRTEWTPKEVEAIKALKKALRALPSTVCLYVIDGGDIEICRVGTPSHVLNDTVRCCITSCSAVSDVHPGDDRADADAKHYASQRH